MMGRNNNNKKKRLVTLTAAAAISLLVSGIVVIGTAQLSYQQSIIGGGFAGRGFITSAMIADDTIVSADLKDGSAVRSSDIVDGQVNTADLADDAVTTDKIRDGEVKEEDLDPSIELGGEAGEGGTLDVHIVHGDGTLLGPGLVGEDSVDCPAGEILTGGGYESDLSTMSVFDNHPRDANTWFVQGYNKSTFGEDRLVAYALCAGASP
jgi:hypothetical protein